MPGNYSYAYGNAAGETVGVNTKSSKKIEKGLKKILVIAGIILAMELIWLFVISPFIPFTTVEVQGFPGFEREEILRLGGINENSSYISTNVMEVHERVSANILVESAVVMKRFPDKLSVFLTPRQAVAVTLGSTGAKQSPLYIDRHGVFYKKAESLIGISVPVISGIESPQLNMRLPSALVSLTESLSQIASDSPELLAAVSEIKIERKAWDGFELVLYPVHSSVRFRVENNLSEEILRYMLLMLNVFEESSPKPDEIDFRSGMGSYKLKEKS